MTDYELDFEWDTTVTRVYQEVIAEADPDDGVGRQEAFTTAANRIQDMVNAGELFVDVSQAIRAALERADKSQGRAADAVIKRLATGQDDLGLDDDPTLNIVVILGDGKRKPWRNVTADDLRDMDRIRYHNYRKQAVAYDEWRESYDAVLPIVSRHGTVGTAASRGAFDHMADTAA